MDTYDTKTLVACAQAVGVTGIDIDRVLIKCLPNFFISTGLRLWSGPWVCLLSLREVDFRASHGQTLFLVLPLGLVVGSSVNDYR